MAKRKRTKGEYGRGSVYPAPNGTGFIVAVRQQSGAKPIRRRASTREAAEKVRQELLEQRAAEIKIQDAAQSVERYSAYWYNEVYLQRGNAERSDKHVLDMLELHILPAIGRRPIVEVQRAELQRLLNDMRRGKHPKSAQTVKHVKSVVTQLFKSAAGDHLLKRNPAENLEAPKIERKRKSALTIEQIKILLATVDNHPHALAYHLMAFLGLRLGEALAVKVTDFTNDFTELTINEALNYHTNAAHAPKRGSVRVLPVPPRLRQRIQQQWHLLKAQQEDAPASFRDRGLLLPSEVGTPIQPSNFEKAWHGYTQTRQRKHDTKTYMHPGFRARACLPTGTTLHDLRRFLATQLEYLEVGQATIGHILGHGAKNVTEVYIKQHLPGMRRALERLEAAVWAEHERAAETG